LPHVDLVVRINLEREVIDPFYDPALE